MTEGHKSAVIAAKQADWNTRMVATSQLAVQPILKGKKNAPIKQYSRLQA
jgi:hypothetical protein